MKKYHFNNFALFVCFILTGPFINLHQIPIQLNLKGTKITKTYILSILLFLLFINLINKKINPLKDAKSHKLISKQFIFFLFLSIIETLTYGLITNQIFINKSIFTFYNSNNIKIIVLSIICQCLFAPILEELFFREVIFNYLKNNLNIFFSIILSSLIFALSHSLFSIKEILYQFLFAIILGIARYKLNNIKSTLTIHIITNFIALISIII